MRYVALDLETDGLLDVASKVHMAILTDLETNQVFGFTDEPEAVQGASQAPTGTIEDALSISSKAELLVTFNGWKFDLMILEKLYPEWTYEGTHIDLMIHGATCIPYDRLLARDAKLAAKGILPKFLVGTEALKAWAIRAGGEQKGEFRGPWNKLTTEMWEYGLQDGRTTASLYHWMMEPKRRVTWRAMYIEQEIGRILGRQQVNGWKIDLPYLQELDISIAKELDDAKNTMVEAFGSWYRLDVQKSPDLIAWEKETVQVKIPKRTMKRDGREYTKGAAFTPITLHTFNPSARMDIYRGLHRKYGWEPHQQTPTGLPKVCEETLKDLEWPEAQAAYRYLMLTKVSGYTTAWLQKERGGRLYGRVNTNRATTRRMTHQDPNLAQVPANGALFGEECRKVFVADPGWVLIGADGEQLELRCLANRLAYYDGGAYANEVLNGDVHTLHVHVSTGLPRTLIEKNTANGGVIRKYGKNVTYAWLYGAGDWKLGQTYTKIPGVPSRSGKVIRAGFEYGITGVADLLKRIKKTFKDKKYIRALDGSRLFPRSEHSLLNLQLQSDGALIMKVSLIMADQILKEKGYREGKDFKWVGNIHDEIQATAPREIAEEVGQALVEGMHQAGVWFKFALPISGEYKIGENWSETH